MGPSWANMVGGSIPATQYQVPLPTPASINATIAQAAAAGGGTVVIPFNNIDCTGAANSVAVTGVSNVRLVGGGWSFNFTALPDDGGVTLKPNFGTIFSGTGVEIGVGYNTVDRVAIYGSNLAFSNACIVRWSVEDIGFKTLKYGIKYGALFAAAVLYGGIKRVSAIGCTYGIYMENFQHMEVEDVQLFGNSDTQMWLRISSGSDLGAGNSSFNRVLCTSTKASNTTAQNCTVRNIVVEAIKGSHFGSLTFKTCQSNRFNNSVSIQAATFHGTANIDITDGTCFRVDMPVVINVLATVYSSSTPTTTQYTGTLNGFTQGLIYYVVSVVGNTIQVAATKGGTAISANASNAGYVHTYGMECFEIFGRDNESSSTCTNITVTELDIEAGGTCMMSIQNCVPIVIGVSGGFADAYTNVGGGVTTLCSRASNGQLFGAAGISRDFDANTTMQLTGALIKNQGSSTPISRIGGFGVGLMQSGVAAAMELFMDPNNYMLTNNLPMPSVYSRNGALGLSGGLMLGNAASFSGTLAPAYGPVNYLTGAGPFSLPALSKTWGGADNNGAGWWLMNNQATAIVVNATSGAKLNGIAAGSRTSITIPANSGVFITGNVDGGGSGAQKGWVTPGFISPSFSYTDSSGTPGAASTATQRGRVSVAAAATSVVVTNPLVTAASMINVTMSTNDATCRLISVVPGAGSFTINFAAATAQTNFDYLIWGEF